MAPDVVNSKRIWWIDSSLIVAYVIFYQSTARRFLDLIGSTVNDNWWSLLLGLFVYTFVTLSLFTALGFVLDRIFNSGRRIEFFSLTKYLLMFSALLSILTVLLVYAASKASDLLF